MGHQERVLLGPLKNILIVREACSALGSVMEGRVEEGEDTLLT